MRPITRRRLYWTARSVFVSDQAQVEAFDAVFCSVFGGARRGEERRDPSDAHTVADAGRRAAGVRSQASPGDSARASARAGAASSRAARRDEDEDGAEVDVPLAMASDEELLAAKSFDALEPDELAQLYRLMSRLELATPLRRTRRYERGRHGRRIDMRRTLRGSLRTGGDPIRLARRRRRIARRRLVLLCDISGSMEPYARAYLQFLACAAGSGPNAEAFVFATRLTRLTRALASRHPERAIQRAAAAAPGLVERHADRRRAEGVQRPPRASGHGARRRGRDPLRRLGARRPGARRARDGAPRAARPPDRVGQPARRAPARSRCGPAAWSPRCRTATRSSAATASRRSARSSTRSAARASAATVAGPGRRAAGEAEEPSRGPAPPRCPAARSRCPAATARAGATRRRAG